MKIGSKTYDVLKNLAQIWLPAAGTLYFTLAQIWNLPSAEEVSGTVLAVDTFLGAILAISSATYKAGDRPYDGTVAILEDADGGTFLKLQSVNPDALTSQNSITFKVVKPPQ